MKIIPYLICYNLSITFYFLFETSRQEIKQMNEHLKSKMQKYMLSKLRWSTIIFQWKLKKHQEWIKVKFRCSHALHYSTT